MLVTLIAGLCLLVLFVVVELLIAKSGGQPLVDLRLFGNGPFLFSNIANAMVGFSFFGALILSPLYLQDLRGVNAFQSGLLILPLAFAAVLAAIIGGWLVDRFGPRIILFAGLLPDGLFPPGN